jgi:hypothetical protein
VLNTPPTFEPYNYGRVLLFATLGILGATSVYGLLRLVVRNEMQAHHIFRVISIVVFVLSCVPDVMIPYSGDIDFVGWTSVVIGKLILMHAAAVWAAFIYCRLEPKERE